MASFLQNENFQQMEPVQVEEPTEPMTTELFVELMAHFYNLGWMKGTGGAMGVIAGKTASRLLISPSAVQKERLKESDIFEYDLGTHQLISGPKDHAITVSSCAPLFTHVMKTLGSRCVLHSHSIYSNLITQLVSGDTFSMSHQEYIKGIYDPFTGRNMKYEDTLVIPIIENKSSESLLLPGLEAAMLEYPRATAVLVRNHGLFVWGNTWQETKIQMECIDYLLELASKMIEKGLPLVKEEIPVKSSESGYQLSFAADDVPADE